MRNLLRLSTEFLPYDSAVWCEAKLVTVAIDSPIRTWKRGLGVALGVTVGVGVGVEAKIRARYKFASEETASISVCHWRRIERNFRSGDGSSIRRGNFAAQQL